MSAAAGRTGRVALVTGAGRMRGIGRAIAMQLAAEGADVAVHAAPRRPEDLPEEERAAGWEGAASVVRELEAAGVRAVAVTGDLTDRDTVRRIVAEATDALGTVDVLVNNAGTAGTTGSETLLELDDEVWYRTIDVNLNATYLVTKAVLPGMLAAERGAIVNISSLAGRTAYARFGSYGASKAGVIALTQQLALEFAPHVRANCVCPGSIDTNMMDGTFRRWEENAGVEAGRARAATIRGIPLGRQGAPDDIARAVAFLASDAAAWITGQTINVNGGNRMD